MSTLAAGTRLGRYLLGEALGEGGSARVYRARDLAHGDQVAIKLFHAGIGGPDDARRHREFTFLTQLTHPNLVPLRDTGVVDGREFLVMELVEGPTLQRRLRDGPLLPEAVSTLGTGLSDALGYVHAHGITHRDVKPGNVLLGARPRLTDFGIARIADTFWATEELTGTPAYLAPEQLLGEPVGPPADVYALGLVLLEALTGRREYPGVDAHTTAARLDRPPDVPPGLPGGLSGLLTAMTVLEPFDRPAAAEVAAALRAEAPGRRQRLRDRVPHDGVPNDGVPHDGVPHDGVPQGGRSRRRAPGQPRPRGAPGQACREVDRQARDRRVLTAAVGAALGAGLLGVIAVPMIAAAHRPAAATGSATVTGPAAPAGVPPPRTGAVVEPPRTGPAIGTPYAIPPASGSVDGPAGRSPAGPGQTQVAPRTPSPIPAQGRAPGTGRSPAVRAPARPTPSSAARRAPAAGGPAYRTPAGTAEGERSGITPAANTAAGGGHDSW